MDNGKLRQPSGEKPPTPSEPSDIAVFGQNAEQQLGTMPEQSSEAMNGPERAMAETKAPNLAPVAPASGSSTTTQADNGMSVATYATDDQNPGSAQDGDKLEKEWVLKTEKVIEQTQQDPKQEEIETNKLKADYLAKRFNRHLGDRNG